MNCSADLAPLLGNATATDYICNKFTDSNLAINNTYLLFSAYFVFIMQCGFAMLCTGAVLKKKNAINVMAINVINAAAGAISYYFYGFLPSRLDNLRTSSSVNIFSHCSISLQKPLISTTPTSFTSGPSLLQLLESHPAQLLSESTSLLISSIPFSSLASDTWFFHTGIFFYYS